VQLQFQFPNQTWAGIPIYPTPGLQGGYQSNTSYDHTNTFFNQSVYQL